MKKYPPKKDDISIVLCGAAGQGIQTVEELLTHAFKHAGYNLFSTKEYMSRVRGGSNSTQLRVSSRKVRACLDKIDILFPLDRDGLRHVEHRITPETIILGEKEVLLEPGTGKKIKIIDVPLHTIASELGETIYINIIATGIIAALFGIDKESIIDDLRERFSDVEKTVMSNNIRAVTRGYEFGGELIRTKAVSVSIKKDPTVADQIIINGGEAVGIGALAGGCNFISSYPMTPSTSVLTFLARQSAQFGIIAEQAEDEIAAMNMAIGAWYAGARAMVTTSGGGFALMTEGLSLAGAMESPMVIHLAQRPGPATGLPTRTEQGDLELALYAGHGEFPRVIFAPGTIEEAFALTAKAFNLADRYQIPVFILTDQYLVDSYYNINKIDVSDLKIEPYIVPTDHGYKRYSLTRDGVSPRGVPANGKGLVIVDSDEHDEEGHLTESNDIRIQMVDKRLRKRSLLAQEAISPACAGKSKGSTMIVCWGSILTIAEEAVKRIGRKDISLVHFSQVYPLHRDTAKILGKAGRLISVEGNATSQFSRLLKIQTGIDMDTKITKYNGLPFSVEELEGRLREVL
ncbi:MAG: 2-oxoacid:acceptor oxidoreductase subunit alpha [Syntrophaceae bacterium]|nr:2-oxoacid:acceptor oxidoreductase subunit alpha [Syntrophaceae bacterium]